MNEIEAYAMNMVIEGARFFVENDIDEDGDLGSRSDWLAALDVARRIVRWIDENSQFILEDINREDNSED